MAVWFKQAMYTLDHVFNIWSQAGGTALEIYEVNKMYNPVEKKINSTIELSSTTYYHEHFKEKG